MFYCCFRRSPKAHSFIHSFHFLSIVGIHVTVVQQTMPPYFVFIKKIQFAVTFIILTMTLRSTATALLRNHHHASCQRTARRCWFDHSFFHSSRQWQFFSSSQSLNDRKAEQKTPSFHIYYNDVYEVQLPPNHRFPMEKYRKVRQLVQQHLRNEDNQNLKFRVSPLATTEELTTTHAPHYVQHFMTGHQSEQELRNVGFPWSPEGVQRAQSSVGGTLAAACHVCESPKRWAAHVAGGTHHAFYSYGEGFCVFSDMAVAANVVFQRFPHIRRILLLDLDVHQGNGNAVLFQNNPNVFTFSIHCSANYFSAQQTSDLDIELPPHCSDNTYLVTLKYWLKQLEQQLPPFDLILFQAGVDVLKEDRLGRMDLSLEGVRRRNHLVYDFAGRNHLPLVICMGGGYPRENDWQPILEAHASVYTDAYEFWKKHVAS